MSDRTLAEIVAEGQRLRIKLGQRVFNERQTCFLYDHGPSLLAVAEKAMEAELVVRNILTAHEASLTERGTLSYSSPSGSTGFIAAIHWLEAFDALAAPAPAPAPAGEGEGR